MAQPEKNVDPFRPNLKQAQLWREAADPGAEIILMDGAIRTGKSQSCARLQVAWALRHPGTVHWAMRKTQKELDDTTKKQMLVGDGGLEPCIPPECLIVHNETKDVAYLRCPPSAEHPEGGVSEIVFRSLETRKGIVDSIKAKLRGTTLASVYIDQVEEFDTESDEESFYELMGRLSDPRGPNKMLLCSNPGSKGHWLYKLCVDPKTRAENVRYVHVTLEDNKHNLAAGYWERMEKLKTSRRVWWRRFVKGEWGVSGGQRFPMLDEEVHLIQPFPLDPTWPILEGLDYGSKNPFACLYATIDFTGRMYVVGEHYEAERSSGYHVDRIMALRQSIQELRGLRGLLVPDEAWWDPSMWARRGDFDSIALELMDYPGMQGAKAQNERRGGWMRLEKLLGENLDDGLPGLMIFSSCTNLWNELTGLKYKVGTDDVEKENDHAADALRYIAMSRSSAPEEEKEDAQGPRERYLEQMKRRLAARGRVQIPGGSHA